MNRRDDKGQKGIVLLQVLAVLTLFGVAGLTFVYYTADDQCVRNPTAEVSGSGCTRTIGNTTNRRP